MAIQNNPLSPRAPLPQTSAPKEVSRVTNPATPTQAQPADGLDTKHVHGASCGCSMPKLSPDQLKKVEAEIADRVEKIQTDRAQGGSSLAPSEPRIIDVYFHVVTQGEGPKNGDVSQEQVEAQIQVLNDAYKGAGFQFRLVETDRTNNAKWYTGQPGTSAETDMKSALRKGDKDALNIYSTSPSGGLLGWATFPSDYQDFPKDDGVVILNTSLPGGSAAPYNEGDTLTHEVGHWMGLHHTFNQPGLPDNDSVDDTPEHEVNYGKPPETTDTVPNKPGNDPVHNYMNYVDDDWMNEFTPGQVDRMKAQWDMFRETQAKGPVTATASAEPKLPIKDLETTTSTLEITEDLSVEKLKLDLDIPHTWRGDLVVTLVSPSGKEAVISNRDGGSKDDVTGSFQLDEAFASESAKGTWTLKVEDKARRDVGTLNAWSLEITGPAAAAAEQAKAA